jgi:3-oxoacyl-[acyl-carrier protein] reductase
VDNAGVILDKLLADMTEEGFDRPFLGNVTGTIFLCQQEARRMAAGGWIVNISSSTTAMMLPTYTVYAPAKGAFQQMTHVRAIELAPPDGSR